MKLAVKKHYFSLLEVMISFSLLSILMSALFGAYWQIHLISGKIDRERAQSFQERLTHFRLNQVMTRVVKGNFYTSEEPHLSIEGQNLIFHYDRSKNNGEDLSEPVLGRLYIDNDYNLSLITWPVGKERVEAIPEGKKEQLMSGVERIEFAFFVPKSEKITSYLGDDEVVPLPGEWIPLWKKEFNRMPTLMKINLIQVREGKEIGVPFAFSFPKVNQPITYSMEK